MNRSATAEYDLREPPDMLSAAPAVLAAPVVAVTRVRQSPPPDLSRVAASVVDIAAQRESAQTGTPPAANPEPDAAPASPPASTDTAHHLALAVPKQSPVPEGRPYVRLASLHSNEDAWYEWRRLNRRMPELLSGHESIIKQAEARRQTYWILRTFGYTSLDEAKAMCARMLDAAGLRCWARLGS